MLWITHAMPSCDQSYKPLLNLWSYRSSLVHLVGLIRLKSYCFPFSFYVNFYIGCTSICSSFPLSIKRNPEMEQPTMASIPKGQYQKWLVTSAGLWSTSCWASLSWSSESPDCSSANPSGYSEASCSWVGLSYSAAATCPSRTDHQPNQASTHFIQFTGMCVFALAFL